MKKFIIKPAQPGATVRFPEDLTRTLKPEGEEVTRNGYWLRRLSGGDVIEVIPEEKSTVSKKSTITKEGA